MLVRKIKRAKLIILAFCILFISGSTYAQKSIIVPAEVEGWYWLVSPKPWFTRQLTVSVGNRDLPINDHDEGLPTRPGYYHRKKESQPYIRYPFKSIVIKKNRATFRTVVYKGQQFIFNGRWGREDDESSNIEDVPYFRGILSTYKNGKLVKTERVMFSHAVNA